jgi:hypothetical protein
MAFLCVQNFTLLQKRIEVFVANSMIKKNHQFFLEIVSFLYMVQVGTNKYTRMFEKKFFHILFDAPILDVGLLSVAGVSCKPNDQLAHSQAISCSPTPRWSTMERC